MTQIVYEALGNAQLLEQWDKLDDTKIGSSKARKHPVLTKKRQPRTEARPGEPRKKPKTRQSRALESKGQRTKDEERDIDLQELAEAIRLSKSAASSSRPSTSSEPHFETSKRQMQHKDNDPIFREVLRRSINKKHERGERLP